MRKSVFTLAALGLLFGLSMASLRAADDDDRDEFERSARRINNMTEKPAVLKHALHHISIETGVPLEKVQAEHKRHPNMGAAGLLLVNVMAAETRKEPEHFVRQRAAGKRWMVIARDNKVSIDKLNLRLDNLEKALGPAVEKKDRKR